MPILSSSVAPEVVIMTTSGATSDDKVGIMMIVCVHMPVTMLEYIP